MYRYIFAVFLFSEILFVKSSDFSTRIEYKQINAVPKDLLHKLEPFKLIGQKYYYIGSKELNWFQAAQECRKLGGNLISLTTNEERQLIGLNLDTSQKYWLDLSNLGQPEFVSIATGSKAVYMKWLEYDIDNEVKENLNCALFVNDYQDGFVMQKTECLKKARFICQVSSARTISMAIW